MAIHVHGETAERLGLTDAAARQLIRRLVERSPDTTLKDDPRSTVTRHDLDGRSWVVKRYHLSMAKRLVYGVVRRTPPWQEWSGARSLASTGIRMSRPLALIHPDRLVLSHHAGRTLHDWMRETSDRHKRLNVARGVGAQIGRITGAGLINRDHKPSNLIVDAACEVGDAEPVLIDPAGLRRRTPAKLLRMLAVLYRATPRAGGITTREGLTALRAAMTADPSVTARSAASLARTVLAQVNARPLSYDPADWL